MTKPSSKELNATMIKGLEYTLTQIKGDIFKAVKRGDMVTAHYYREQYSITEAIIEAIKTDRIARTDAEVEQFIQNKN